MEGLSAMLGVMRRGRRIHGHAADGIDGRAVSRDVLVVMLMAVVAMRRVMAAQDGPPDRWV